jgi:hypothetical protein
MAGHLQRTQPTRNFPKGGWEARWQEDVNGRPSGAARPSPPSAKPSVIWRQWSPTCIAASTLRRSTAHVA